MPELLDVHLQILLLKWLRGTARWQSHTSNNNARNTAALTAHLERASDSQVCDFICNLSCVLENNKIYQCTKISSRNHHSVQSVAAAPAVTRSWFWASLGTSVTTSCWCPSLLSLLCWHFCCLQGCPTHRIKCCSILKECYEKGQKTTGGEFMLLKAINIFV